MSGSSDTGVSAEIARWLGPARPLDPARVERAAAYVLLSTRGPDGGRGELIAALEQRADATAAAVLVGVALLADEPTAVAAAAAATRLRDRGVLAGLGGRLGGQRVSEAWSTPLRQRRVLWVRLDRDGAHEAQLAWFLLADHPQPRLLAGELRAPADPAEALAAFRASAPSEAEGLTEHELRETLRAAAAVAGAVPLEAAIALLLVAFALSESAEWAQLPVLPAADVARQAPRSLEGLRIQPGDDAALYARMDELLDEMGDWIERDARSDPLWRTGDFVAGAMIEFKGRVGDGRLAEWSSSDLRRFLLEWFPRAVAAPQETLADVLECAAGFLRFLADRGTLGGDPLPVLESTCIRLTPEFAAACAASERSQQLLEDLDPRRRRPGRGE